MLPELGHFALILALCLACVQSILPLLGAAYQRPRWMAVAKPAAFGQFIFISVAFASLIIAFGTNDFSVAYVAENSSTQLPLIYRLCAVWGAHEGSLLLWVWILSVWMVAVCIKSHSLPQPMLARVLSVMGMISIGFLLFLLSTSNPFTRMLLDTPSNGQDLNPLLQDPGFIIHPPMLYTGYVGFSVAFAFAIASLIAGEFDNAWIRWTRPWTLIAWCFLTYGIVLGSWWAYRELGWGGWWFWDPVENASFMPWLMGTALLHSLAVTEKRGAFRGWTLLLAIFAFSLSLLGTFLVRSGIIISVHAFAVDPTRGLFMLIFISIVVGCSLTLYAWRAPQLKSGEGFALLSREGLLLSNNVLLVVSAATVLLGTMYPLILQALHWGSISVGPPYFNTVFIPIMVLVLFFMGIGPHCQWQKMLAYLLVQRLRYTLLTALALALILLLVFTHAIDLSILLGISLALWVIFSVLQDTALKISSNGFFALPRSQFGMLFGHMGLAITAIGIILTTSFSTQRLVSMSPGDSTAIGSHQFKFLTIENLTGPNYKGAVATVQITDAAHTKIVRTEKRIYTVREMALAKVALDITPFRDLYVALGDPLQADAWSFRIYYKPFVRWIWGGGVIMIFGGLLAMSDRRYRK